MTRTRMAGLLVLALLVGCGGGGSDAPVPGELKLSAAAFGAAEDAGTATLTVTRTGGSDGAATVAYATADGTATAGADYTGAAGTLSWADGDAAAKTITITIDDDADVEGDETVTVTLSNATGATLGTPAAATVSITDDDAAPASLSGIAATGAPITGATITVVDANGTSAATTTGNDGMYSVDITGLQPPLLVRVDAGGGATLFSVSNADAPTVVNVHPLTDLVVRAWYEAQGTTVAEAFDDPVANPPPAPEQVAFIVDVVERVVTIWLSAAGIDADEFDLIATPFTADGSGFDGILDDTAVDPVTGVIEIDDGTTNQIVTVTTGTTLTLSSTTTGPGGTSSSVASTVVPVDDGATDAFAGIKATLDDVASLVEAAGDELTAADLLPFISADAIDEGRDRETIAAVFASELRGITVSGELGTLHEVGEGVVVADLVLHFSLGELTGTETLPMRFVLEDEVWKFGGNGSGVSAEAQMERRIDLGQSGGDEVYHAVNVHVNAPVDSVESITISGGGIFDVTPIPFSGQISIEELEPNPGDFVEIQSENWFVNSGALQDPVPAGTVFTITVNYLDDTTETITSVTGGTTDEVVTITSPTAHTLATANLGGELAVEWELPTTFVIADLQFGALAFTEPQGGGGGGFVCAIEADPEPATDATSGAIAVPAACNGDPVVEVNINLAFNGVNGERIQVIYFMGDET